MADTTVSAEVGFIFNTLLFLICGFLVMFMACGFAMLESGMVTSKSVSVICAKNIGLFSIAGPLNLAAALGIKSFGLIANDPVSELKYSKIIPIVPKDYVDNVWYRDRNGMKNLKPDEVFNQVIENL